MTGCIRGGYPKFLLGLVSIPQAAIEASGDSNHKSILKHQVSINDVHNDD